VPRVLLIFLDGVGIGPADPEVNPFLRAELPVLCGLLEDVPTLAVPVRASGDARLLPLDASLGVPGLPQSGTGQIALLTGENAPSLFGRHFGPWPPVRLRPLLEERSLLRQGVEAGLRVAFANAYPEGYPGDRSSRRVAAPPLAAAAAGLLTRHHDALRSGEAVASEIVNEGWRRHLGFTGLPAVTPAQAGRNLARIAADADLTLFAHYLTDHAGHRGGMAGAIEALERVDAFLGGVLDRLSEDTLLLVASDHGNVEDVRAQHTLNPALGLAVGPGAGAAAGMRAITEVAPAACRALGI
jgi:2,3-bisphosphoglycerate-independent phosphoglycerate mutase